MGTASSMARQGSWPDDRLVRECLQGSEQAWSALVDKYKRLVYSIPVKYSLSADDATDVFQEVFLELISHLDQIREPKALPMLIIRTTTHQCSEPMRQMQRFSDEEDP